MPFCLCAVLPGLVLACSGGSAAGHLADQAARLLDERRVARMASLASIGGQVPTAGRSAARLEQVATAHAGASRPGGLFP